MANLRKPLTPRQREVLRSLGARWVRPMDIGGRDSSDHSAILTELVKQGRAERQHRGSNRSWCYRHTGYGEIADALALGLHYARAYSPPDDTPEERLIEVDQDRQRITRALERFLQGTWNV